MRRATNVRTDDLSSDSHPTTRPTLAGFQLPTTGRFCPPADSTALSKPIPQSVYDLLPLETGGVEARKGFALQDHVAAGFCLDMLGDDGLREVWCESQDDITLLWGTEPTVEFVQVKSNELNQLWTVAKLCERDAKGNGSSRCILEKSLAFDRCKENLRFRLVTARPVATELKVLTIPLGDRAGGEGQQALAALCKLLRPKVTDYKSSNGNDYAFWTCRAFWDVRHEEKSVRLENIDKLCRHLQKKDVFLASEHLDELYSKCLRKVWDASCANGHTSPSQKRIMRCDFEQWLYDSATQLGYPSDDANGRLVEKMKAAAFPDDTIMNAVEQKRYYRHELLSPRYMQHKDRPMVEAEVRGLLQRLKSRLDNGELPDNGLNFHSLCLQELEQLRSKLSLHPAPPESFLQGCMYSITARCIHRFKRITA